VTDSDHFLSELKEELRRFAAERDWEGYHSPKNLAMALAVEASELLEHFQWLTEQQSRELGSEKSTRVSEELADTLIYLVRLADRLEIDLETATRRKMAMNAKKYPAHTTRQERDPPGRH
jgi:dCTP diphosphatase